MIRDSGALCYVILPSSILQFRRCEEEEKMRCELNVGGFECINPNGLILVNGTDDAE